MLNYLNLFKDDNLIDYESIDENIIQKIAEAIFMKYVLIVENKEFRICEIEFYVKNNNHDNKYTHSDSLQKTFGKWYFHRYPNGSYKSGTWKGIDLTLGNNNTFFGVLIRSIYDSDVDEMIEGPCKVVNLILQLSCDKNDVKEYMENKKSPLSARSIKNFYLKRKQNLSIETIYKGPRIGLSDKYPEWKTINYRFIIKKNYIKKGKKVNIIITINV
jgi:3-methyladenine DNA glycosylase Mpg